MPHDRAIGNLRKQPEWHQDKVDPFEISQAFAITTILSMRERSLDQAKVNT